MERLFAVLVFLAFSVKANTSGDWQYSVLNGEATITGYTGSGDAVTIPSSLNGFSVKKVGDGSTPVFGNPNTNVTSITVPDSVTSIGALAFASCTKLRFVFVPDGVQFGNNTDPVLDDHTTVISPNLLNAFATNDAFITAVADKIKGTSGNYGLATQSGVSNTINAATSGLVTQSEITPLATKSELTNSLTQSRTDGVNSVLGDPGRWNLYSTNEIMNMGFGGLMLARTNDGSFTFNYNIEKSEDLQNWTTYQEYGLPLTNLPANKAFVRIKPKQVTDDVMVKEKILQVNAPLDYIRSAAAYYYSSYTMFPVDGARLAINPWGSTYTRTYGDGAMVSIETTTFGDLLLSEGFLDRLRIPIGANGYSNAVTYTASSISLSQDGVGRTTPVNAGAINYPLVLCRVAPGTSIFTGSNSATRTIFVLIPGLTLSEAAALKTFIDGPFDSTTPTSAEIVAKAVAGTATGNAREWVNRGNCRLTPSPLAGGGYDAWCYITND